MDVSSNTRYSSGNVSDFTISDSQIQQIAALEEQLKDRMQQMMQGYGESLKGDSVRSASGTPSAYSQCSGVSDLASVSGTSTPSSVASLTSTATTTSQTPTSGFGDGSLGGANTVPDRIASPEAATAMVDQVKQAGGGTLRIQMSHDEINNSADMAKLQALVAEGNKQGVKIQFTFRDNDNGGGGNVLSGSALQQASDDIKNVISQVGNNPSFVLDTFNEGGTSATQGWADMQSTLIKSARDAGYKGSIVVEDSNWGGGLTAGSQSGLVNYASQLNAANGEGNPGLIGSIHEYASGSDASSRLTQEINALEGAGYKPQIGEVGNANWTGGSNFEERDGAVQAVKDNIGALQSAGASVLPWMDQFVDGSISHDVGFSASDQLISGTSSGPTSAVVSPTTDITDASYSPDTSDTTTTLPTTSTLATTASTSGSTSASTLPSSSSSDPAQAIASDLETRYGLNQTQVAGVLGNLEQESNLESDVNQGGVEGAPSSNFADDNGNGWGIAQWGGTRKQAEIDYANQNNLDPGSLQANIGFINQELDGSYSGTVSALKSSTSVEEAATAWDENYEEASDPQMDNRIQDAQTFLKEGL